LANGSTLFLDEVGELPLELQAKLLRVVQDGEFERLGSPKTIRVDVRVIAATNRDLAECVKNRSFRQDLYYRLNVFSIHVPPLRERAEDIPLLAWAFVREFERKMGKNIQSIPKKTMEGLQRHPWPGNIRELENLIERAMILSPGNELEYGEWLPALKTIFKPGEHPIQKLEEVEKDHIIEALKKLNWKVSGPAWLSVAVAVQEMEAPMNWGESIDGVSEAIWTVAWAGAQRRVRRAKSIIRALPDVVIVLSSCERF
jgi:chemotaxis protein methyltransferase CheR